MTKKLFLFASTICFVVLLPLAAAAQGDARELFGRGQTAYDQGDYETAVTHWNSAYELDPRPLIQYNLARAFQNLGRLTEAGAALDLYLQHADASDANQGNARALRSSIRERLTRTGIIVSGGPDGATISVDGQEWGRTPRPDKITVDPGSHQVVVTREGYRDFRSSVVVPAGDTVTLTVEMEESTDGAGGGGDVGGGGEVAPADGGGPGIAPWLLVGGGGALIVTAAVIGLVALGAANDAPNPDSSEADSARTLGLVADILAFTGTLAIAGGMLWFFLTKDSGEERVADVDFDIYPVVGPDVAGAGANLRF